MNPKISLIAAISRTDRGMGYKGKIQWHIKGEQARFKRLTLHHIIIMGRKTFESIGHVLPDRVNIVISRDPNYTTEDVIVAHSLDEAMDKAWSILRENSTDPIGGDEIFIIGGGELFKQTIDTADKLYLTLVDGDYPADTYFPDYKAFTKETYREDGEVDGTTFTYLDLERP